MYVTLPDGDQTSPLGHRMETNDQSKSKNYVFVL